MNWYKFSHNKRIFKHDFTSAVGNVIAFGDFKLFIYFEIGKYTVEDIFNDKNISSGKFKNDIVEMVPLNCTNLVAYIDREECKLKVFDFEKGEHVEKLFKNLPTGRALGNEEYRSDKNKTSPILEEIEIISLP